jgi:hypothetical protein
MKKLTVAVMLGLLAANAQGMTVEDYLRFKKDPNGKRTLELVVDATGRAFGWANAALEDRGDKPLYCVPATLILQPESYLKILDNQIAYFGEGADEVPFQVLLMQGLQRTFPCQPGN